MQFIHCADLNLEVYAAMSEAKYVPRHSTSDLQTVAG